MTMPGPLELVIILVIVMLLFGAKKLPELGGAIGKSIRSFKSGIEDEEPDGEDSPDAAGDSTPTPRDTP